jgi:hypothetical protein
MRVQEVHQRYFRASMALSLVQVKNMISPLDVIRVLNAAKVSFVLVGAHGVAGWMKKPRATQDVDVVVAERHLKKAIKALTAAFPQLEAEDTEVVIRLRDRDTAEVAIDLIKPRELYRQTFHHTRTVSEGEQVFRIPSLEMALAMKFAAMVSPNRAVDQVYQDAHDFIVMVKENPELDSEQLHRLGCLVYGSGGDEVLEMVRKARAGEMLEL